MLVRRSLYPATQINHEKRRMRYIDLARLNEPDFVPAHELYDHFQLDEIRLIDQVSESFPTD
jgi:hypothetical protein